MKSAVAKMVEAIRMRARDVARQPRQQRVTERDHRERAAVEADGARHGDAGSEQQHDQQAHRTREVSNGDDDVAIDHCGSDHGAQDHRQDGAQGRAPVAGPEGLPRSRVRRQIARVVGHVRRVSELPERTHGHHGEEADGRE